MNYSIIAVLAFPILLIHGYAEDSHVWDSFQKWFGADHIKKVYPVRLDECGSVADHAKELKSIVSKVLHDTNSTKVNIIAHSKGGLDSRWYISHSNKVDRVANLIMIATPNNGTPAAYVDLTQCSFEGSAGLKDIKPDSVASQAPDNILTKYYTIEGDYPIPCFFAIEPGLCFAVPNDGFVTVESGQGHYQTLGIFHYNHNQLLKQKDVYDKVLSVSRG